MEAELGQLRVCVALLKKNSFIRAKTVEGYTDVEVQTDLDIDAEVIDTLTDGDRYADFPPANPGGGLNGGGIFY